MVQWARLPSGETNALFHLRGHASAQSDIVSNARILRFPPHPPTLDRLCPAVPANYQGALLNVCPAASRHCAHPVTREMVPGLPLLSLCISPLLFSSADTQHLAALGVPDTCFGSAPRPIHHALPGRRVSLPFHPDKARRNTWPGWHASYKDHLSRGQGSVLDQQRRGSAS